MLADLKMSSLAYKFAFYRPKHNAKGELNLGGLEM